MDRRYAAREEFLKAVEAGDFALCQVLMDRESLDPTTAFNQFGLSALHVCAQFSRLSIAAILISQVNITRNAHASAALQAWVNRPCSLGLTALHYAVMNDNLDLACFFLNIGADLRAKTRLGMTVMHLAARANSPLCLAYFHEAAGLSWTDRADDGSTPLHEAARYGGDHAILLLLAWDTDKTTLLARDQQGNCPLHLALAEGRRQTAAILMQAGADMRISNDKGQSAYQLAADSENLAVRQLAKSNSLLVSCGIAAPRSREGRKWRLVVLAEAILLAINAFTVICSADLLPFAHIWLGVCLFLQQVFFLLTVFTSPFTQIPPQQSLLELYRWNPKARVCPVCRILQPFRAIHCPTCAHCTVRFDHHCPWINNCIGAANLAYFFLMLLATMGDVGLCAGTAGYWLAVETGGTEVYIVGNWAIMVVAVPVACAVGVLASIQSKNFMRNETTFERFSRKRKEETGRHARKSSCWRNCSIMCSQSGEVLEEPLLIRDL